MTTNASITVWHYIEEKETYARSVFEHVSMHRVKKNAASLNSRSGMRRDNCCKIRIPVTEDIKVYIGDYIRSGIHAGKLPDRLSDMKVKEIADNRRGGVPHWRISCE